MADRPVAIVTGGSRGIGKGIALELARLGYDLMIAHFDFNEQGQPDEANALETQQQAKGLGAQCEVLRIDISSAADRARLVEATRSVFGRCHLLANNAGVAPGGPMLDTTPEDWRWVIDVNVLGVAYGVTTFAPLMVEAGEGHIVNTASEAGLTTNDTLGMYCASKHAVVGLSESLYRELEETPVGVSVLCPNLVRTGIFHSERNRRLRDVPVKGREGIDDVGPLG